jgi:hypothetical protein
MERTNGIQNAVKKVAAVLFLTAAMASTGCGQNALMNPTAAQVAGAGSSSYSAAGHDLNPAGHELNP